jgi:signal transduction histidine kinase
MMLDRLRVWSRPGPAASTSDGGRDLLLATTLLLGIVTVAFTLVGDLRFAVYAPQLDIAIHTLGTVASLAVAVLCYARFREQGGVPTLLQASAFLVLASANLANEIAVLADLDAVLGLTLGAPGQMPLYFWAAARLVSAGLLAASAVPQPAWSVRLARRPRVVLWLPTTLLGAGCAVVWVFRDAMPVLVDPATLQRLAEESFAATPLPGINVGILLLDGAAGVLLALAALLFTRGPRRSGGIQRDYLIVGLLIAAFSQVHFILYPAVYTGLVSTGDGLRIAFYLILMAGISASVRADFADLRAANARLRLLAAAETDRAAIAERARLARELHDGLAQDLWTTKLEFDRLAAALPVPDPSVAALVVRVRRAIDAAAREARDAVAALRQGFDAGLSLADELPRRLDAFADRTGYPIDLELDPDAATLPGIEATEALRIVDEALHNVQKHADATRIRVGVKRMNEVIAITVEDNGQGFVPGTPTEGHGLIGMQERAMVLGGRLDITSAPGDGTSVRLEVPAARSR